MNLNVEDMKLYYKYGRGIMRIKLILSSSLTKHNHGDLCERIALPLSD